jgi:tetratricopeptide (TPR) repeat protein
VWDARTGQPLLQPLSHTAYVETAQFSSDGKRILTASLDGTAHVWDAETGHPLTEPLKHFWGQSAQFSPDGTRVVTWSAEGTARIWDIAPSPTRHPEWLLPLAEALSGKRVGPQGVVEETWSNRIAVVHQVQEALSRTNAPADDWVLWGRWLLADRSTRTISPFSKVTVQQYIDNRIKEQTVASLDEAETLAAGNPNLSFRVSQARRALDETNRPVLVQREDVALVSQGRLAEAEAAQRELLAIRKRLLGEEHRDVVTPPGDLARGFREQGKIVEADSLQRESLATRDEVSRRDSLANARKTWPDDPEKWVISLNKQVDVLLRERKYPEAEQLFKELTAAIESRPGSVGLLRSRATFRARSGRWQEAAADFSRLVVVQPENHDGYHCLAPLLVRTGDLEGYRRQCAQVLARFGPTQSPFIAERMTKLCLILPSSGVDLGAVDQMAETAVTVQETNHYLYYFQFAKGFAEHRQGHFSSSVEWIQKMLPKAGAVPFLDAEAHLVLAMAQHRLKHENEAQAALAKAVEIVETKLPRLDSGDIGPSWTDWIIAHALLGEARGLIEGHGPVSTDNAVKPNK